MISNNLYDNFFLDIPSDVLLNIEKATRLAMLEKLHKAGKYYIIIIFSFKVKLLNYG